MELNNIFELFLEEDEVKEGKILGSGYKRKEMQEMIKAGVIQKTESNKYKINNINKLYKYAVNLYQEGNHILANKIIKKCYTYNPKHKELNMEMFMKAIVNQKFEESFLYFDELYGNNVDILSENKNINLYLFILSHITVLPKKYQKISQNINYDDIFESKVSKDNIKNIIYKDIIRLIYEGNFQEALKEVTNNLDKWDLHNATVSRLLRKAIITNKIKTKEITKDIRDRDYVNVLYHLKKNKNQRNLTKYEEYAVKLSLELINKTKNINNIKHQKKYITFFDVLDAKDYTTALEICRLSKTKLEMGREINNIYINLLSNLTDTKRVIINLEDNEREKITNITKEVIKNKHLIILEPESNSKRNQVHKVVSLLKNASSFHIGTGKNKRVVIKYYNESIKKLDPKDLISEINNNYYQKQYDKCIENSLQLLSLFKVPKPYVFIRLGLSYLCKGEYEMAHLYLSIAQDHEDKSDNLDYSELLRTIENKNTRQDPKVKLSEFEECKGENYNIQSLDEIKYLILNENLSLSDICRKFNLTSYQLNIIKILIAKEYFMQNSNVEAAEKLLVSVEQSKDKNKDILKLLDETRKNKKIYRARK